MDRIKPFIILLLVIIAFVSYRAISKKESTNDLLAFSFQKINNPSLSIDLVAKISGTDIRATLPLGTRIQDLKATFRTNGEQVKVNSVTQVSAKNSLDFSGPQAYRVIAEDGTTQTYNVDLCLPRLRAGAVSGCGEIPLQGLVTTLAGSAGVKGSSDGTGKAARFILPTGIATDGKNIYISDLGNHTIRQMVIATGEVTTLAGKAGTPGHADGIGSAAKFNSPKGITTDGTNLYIADHWTHTIRKLVIATRSVTTLAGQANRYGHRNGMGTGALLRTPNGMVLIGNDLYFVDQINNAIRKLNLKTKRVTDFAGSTGVGWGSNDAIGIRARFNAPEAMTTDGTSLFVTDRMNDTIRKVDIATARVTTLAGTAGFRSNGSTAGHADGMGGAAKFRDPYGLTTDGIYLYVADTTHTIRKIEIATGVVTTLTGLPNKAGMADGAAGVATFNIPYGITSDGKSLFVADLKNHTIRRID